MIQIAIELQKKNRTKIIAAIKTFGITNLFSTDSPVEHVSAFDPAYLFFVGALQDKLGGTKRAIYKKCPEVGFIFITIGLTISETAQILIHEYSHHLAQADHNHILFELYKEHLTDEFRKGFEEFFRGGGGCTYDGERED